MTIETSRSGRPRRARFIFLLVVCASALLGGAYLLLVRGTTDVWAAAPYLLLLACPLTHLLTRHDHGRPASRNQTDSPARQLRAPR